MRFLITTSQTEFMLITPNAIANGHNKTDVWQKMLLQELHLNCQFYCNTNQLRYLIVNNRIHVKLFLVQLVKSKITALIEVYVILFNPYKPSILFVGHRQTVQTQIIRC